MVSIRKVSTMPLPWMHTLVASAFFMVVAMVTNIVIRNR